MHEIKVVFLVFIAILLNGCADKVIAPYDNVSNNDLYFEGQWFKLDISNVDALKSVDLYEKKIGHSVSVEDGVIIKDTLLFTGKESTGEYLFIYGYPLNPVGLGLSQSDDAIAAREKSVSTEFEGWEIYKWENKKDSDLRWRAIKREGCVLSVGATWMFSEADFRDLISKIGAINDAETGSEKAPG